MNTPEDAQALKPCKMCAQDIKATARKCAHCGSYQSWMLTVSEWTTVLSLVVALVAVSGSILPVIKYLRTPQIATFRFSEPVFNPGYVSVRASNTGAEAGEIEFAVITIPQKSAGQPYIYILPAKRNAQGLELPPGGSRRFEFVFNRNEFDAPKVNAQDRPCQLEIADAYREVGCDEVRYMATNLEQTPNRKGLLLGAGPSPLAPPGRWQRYEFE